MAVVTTFDELSRDLLKIARTEYPAKTKGMLRKASKKLQKKAVAKAKAEVGEKTGSYQKGFKTGKVYRYENSDDCIRVYNGAPHAHLIEYGHKQTDKTGKDYGYTPGKHILENAGKDYEGEFEEDVEKFIDDLLDKHGLT